MRVTIPPSEEERPILEGVLLIERLVEGRTMTTAYGRMFGPLSIADRPDYWKSNVLEPPSTDLYAGWCEGTKRGAT